MKAIRTISCKLLTTKPQQEHIERTLKAFSAACNFVADYGRKTDKKRQFTLHRGCYYNLRSIFKLKANLASRAIARTAVALRRNPNSRFKPSSVDFDERIFSFNEHDWSVKLTLLESREKFYLHLGDYQRQALSGQHPTSAQLTKGKKHYFINIQIKEDVPESSTSDGILGVDLGIKNIATTSDGVQFGGEILNTYRLKQHKTRRSLQSKAGTGKRSTCKNARRTLKQLSGKESRAVKNVNHTISKKIVETAAASGRSIALENLKDIRKRTNPKLRRSQRGLHNSWAFYALQQMIIYKAMRTGVAVIKINPAYTSQICSFCGSLGHRSGQIFSCANCSAVLNADVNAARNIAAVGAAINQPEDSSHDRVKIHEVTRG